MTTLALTVNVTNPDAEDRLAMGFMIDRENDRRTRANVEIEQENVRRAAQNPPLDPLPLLTLLAVSTAAERKTSYETILNEIITKAHKSYIKQAVESSATDSSFASVKEKWANMTVAQRAQWLAFTPT